MKLRLTVLVALLVAAPLGTFAQSKPAPAAQPSLETISASALSKKVQLSRDDLGRLARDNSVDNKRVGQALQHCNDGKYRWTHGKDLDGNVIIWTDAGRECGNLAQFGLKSLGHDNSAVELAFQRACFLPDEITPSTRINNWCAELGDLYVQRGDLDMALAIYQNAPNCNIDFTNSPAPTYHVTECLTGEKKIFALQHDVARERSIVSQLCSKYGVYDACSRLNELGGSVDLKAVEADNEAASKANAERIKENKELQEEHQRQHDERFNAVVRALGAVPADSNTKAQSTQPTDGADTVQAAQAEGCPLDQSMPQEAVPVTRRVRTAGTTLTYSTTTFVAQNNTASRVKVIFKTSDDPNDNNFVNFGDIEANQQGDLKDVGGTNVSGNVMVRNGKSLLFVYFVFSNPEGSPQGEWLPCAKSLDWSSLYQ